MSKYDITPRNFAHRLLIVLILFSEEQSYTNLKANIEFPDMPRVADNRVTHSNSQGDFQVFEHLLTFQGTHVMINSSS